MFFTRDIGIDLGTANTLVYMKGRGIIIREPSVVAVDVGSDKVRCVGEAAKEVIGRTPDSVAVVRPLRDGVIADFDITISMLEDLIRRATGSSLLIRPRVVICVPSGVTGVERRAGKGRHRTGRRPEGAGHRGTDGGGAGGGAPGVGTDRFDGRRHRRRDDRSGGHLAGRHCRLPQYPGGRG